MLILPDDEENPETVKTGKVSVTVKDTDGNGVSGATVTLSHGGDEYNGSTGSAGGCTINNIPIGDYSVEASASGYVNEIDDITVVEGNNTLNIILIKENNTATVKYGNLLIELVDTNGTVPDDVEAVLSNADETFEGTSDMGQISIEHIPYGEYNLRLSKDEYVTLTKTVVIDSDECFEEYTLTFIEDLDDTVDDDI